MTPRKTQSADPSEVNAIEGDELPITPAPLPPVAKTPPASVEPVVDSTTPSHVLDSAPVNSKIVLVRTEGVLKAVLMTPEGPTVLPADDPASKLPEGASIGKVAPGKFRAWQLSPAVDYPMYETKTAGEAIAQFVPHFHRAT